MKINFGVCCDYAYIDPSTGKLSVLGVIRYLHAAAVPVQLNRICIAVELTATLAEARSQMTVKLELVNQDGVPVSPGPIELPVRVSPLGPDEPNRGIGYLVVELDHLVLQSFGTYSLMIFDANRVELGAVKFTIIPVQRQALPAGT